MIATSSLRGSAPVCARNAEAPPFDRSHVGPRAVCRAVLEFVHWATEPERRPVPGGCSARITYHEATEGVASAVRHH